MAVCSSCEGPLLLDALPMVVKNSCVQKECQLGQCHMATTPKSRARKHCFVS
jgi:hypothetical protein